MPSPQIGGCWICEEGNGYEDDDMAFDMEYDTFYHPSCLPEGVSTILEYEGGDFGDEKAIFDKEEVSP